MERQIDYFKNTLPESEPPDHLPPHLQALWYDGKGDWSKAHDLIDHLSDKQSSHVHAYLHRKEGDLWNADYWYRRAGEVRPEISLEEEWDNLVRVFLGD